MMNDDWTTLQHQGLCVRCCLRAQLTVATWTYQGMSLCVACLAHQHAQDAAAGRPAEPDVQPLAGAGEGGG